MLSSKDERLIKTYGLLLQVATPCLAMSFVSIVLWGVLVFLDDMVFDSQSFYDAGIIVALVFCVVALFGFCYSLLRVKFGTSGKRWAKLVEGELAIYQETDLNFNGAMNAVGTSAAGRLMGRSGNEAVSAAGTATQLVGAAETIGVAADQTATLMGNVQAVADYYNVKIPSPKKYVAAIFVIPIVVIIGVYVPKFIASHEYREAELAVVADAIAPIKASYEKVCGYVSGDDDADRIQDTYWVSAHTKDELNSYVLVELDGKGEVVEVSYHVNYPAGVAPETTLALFNKKILELERPLVESGAASEYAALITTTEIPKQLMSEFVKCDLSESFFERAEEDGIRYSLSYYPEKNSSESYMYFSIEPGK